MRETAYAKINLALHVRARAPDGYHRIETLFAFAEDGDTLSAAAPDQLGAIELVASGPFASALGDAADNLVPRAAEELRAHYAVEAGVRLHLDKKLPVAAGLGGGSADAAAALRLLVPWWGLAWDEPAMQEIARKLGADVPACLASCIVRGDGRGDQLRAVAPGGLTGAPILLVNPGVKLATGPVFAAWDGVDRGALGADPLGRNDLEAPARILAPVIGEVLAALDDAPFARMSGSGATCFGIYPDIRSRDAAAARIAADRPGWWVFKSRLR